MEKGSESGNTTNARKPIPFSNDHKPIPPSKWTFRIRPATAQDRDALFDIHEREQTQHKNTGSAIEKSKSRVDTQTMIPNELPKTQSTKVIHVVAEASWSSTTTMKKNKKDADFQYKLQSPPPCLPYNILGSASLLPYQPDQFSAGRNCFDRTATLHISVLDDSLLRGDDRRRVRGALIRDILNTCRENGLPYRTITASVPFREGQAQLQESAYVLQEEGFRVVGMLEEVMEKNGLLLNLMMLQRSV